MTTPIPATNPTHSEIDLDATGKHLGYLRLPHAVHRSTYGGFPILVASIRNGEGPVVLVMAGNYGDEYESQIIVSQLIREIDMQHVRGQLILLPIADFPAATADTHTAPLDEGNLKQRSPDNATGTPAQLIARCIEHTLLKRADYLVDLHSGGSSLLYDAANMFAVEPREREETMRVKTSLAASGLPKAFLRASDAVISLAAAGRQGAISILAELGGAGMSSAELIRDGHDDLLHFLGFIGVLHGPLVPAQPPTQTRFLCVEGSTRCVRTTMACPSRSSRGKGWHVFTLPARHCASPLPCSPAATAKWPASARRLWRSAARRGGCLFHLVDHDSEYD